MNKEIYRNRIPSYNNNSFDVIAERTVNVGKPILQDPSEYMVAIESACVDLSKAVLDPNPDYKILIWCDLKPETSPPTPDGMVYGPNLYTFSGELTELKQFTHWIEDTLLKKPLPFNLGLYQLNSDEFFQYSIPSVDFTSSFDSGFFEVYFNEDLCRIMEGFYTKDYHEVYQDQIFYKMTPKPGTTTSNVDTIYRLNKIESLLFTTTLPITDTQILDARLNSMVTYPILGSVEINNLTYSISTKADWRYIPQVLKYYTMNQGSKIDQYNIRVLLQYNDTSIKAHTLGPGERFIVNLGFFPRGSVEY